MVVRPSSLGGDAEGVEDGVVENHIRITEEVVKYCIGNAASCGSRPLSRGDALHATTIDCKKMEMVGLQASYVAARDHNILQIMGMVGLQASRASVPS